MGSGEIPVSAVENLLTVATVSAPLAQAVAEAIAAGDLHGGELVNNPSWAVGRGAAYLPKGAFAALPRQPRPAATSRRCGSARSWTPWSPRPARCISRSRPYAYGPPAFRFNEQDTDQARAAGVLIEFAQGRGYGNTAPIIIDHAVYRELAKQVIPRTVEELRARLAAKGKRKTTTGAGAGAEGKRERTPREDLDAEHRANLREFTRQAHLVNLDLGTALLRDLTVSPEDVTVAKFFAYGLLGPESSAYLGTSDHAARTIAANGLRLVVEEHRTTTTPTLKSGKPGKTKVAYGEVEDASKWLWKFLAGAKTAGEVYSRALVVYAAQHYASQLVLPTAQRRSSALPRSYKDTARKAFEQITKSILPASYVQLQRAIAAEARSYHKQVDAAQAAARARSPPRPQRPATSSQRRRTSRTPPSTPRSTRTSTSTTTGREDYPGDELDD